MKLELDFEKSIEENASLCFEQSKKAKRKLLGLQKAIEDKKSAIARHKKASNKEAPTTPTKKQKQEWFESFHWFLSSDNFLVISGRSAKNNEQIVKKHLSQDDFFLHADIPGGAATIIKAEGKKVPESTFKEAAQFAAVFSRAWKSALPSVDVYAVKPEQVSKSAPSGTALATGAFMIYGKRRYFKKTPLIMAIGLDKSSGKVISGPPSAIKKRAQHALELAQGRHSASEAAKQILSVIVPDSGARSPGMIDNIVKALPSGELRLKAD